MFTRTCPRRGRSLLTLEQVFPPFALRIACGPVELRALRDDDLPELAEVLSRSWGIDREAP